MQLFLTPCHNNFLVQLIIAWKTGWGFCSKSITKATEEIKWLAFCGVWSLVLANHAEINFCFNEVHWCSTWKQHVAFVKDLTWLWAWVYRVPCREESEHHQKCSPAGCDGPSCGELVCLLLSINCKPIQCNVCSVF